MRGSGSSIMLWQRAQSFPHFHPLFYIYRRDALNFLENTLNLLFCDGKWYIVTFFPFNFHIFKSKWIWIKALVFTQLMHEMVSGLDEGNWCMLHFLLYCILHALTLYINACSLHLQLILLHSFCTYFLQYCILPALTLYIFPALIGQL
jgi:hypothetical protein